MIMQRASAQCGPYKHHPVWPQTLGYAYLNPGECGPADQVLWDNGATTWTASNLAVGAHTVVLFSGLTPIDTLAFWIEQQQWELNQQVYSSAGQVEVSIWAEVDRCTPQLFDGLACPVDPAQTVAYLLQDGVAIDSLTPVDCIATVHWWSGLPFGHTYATRVEDHGPCGSQGEGPVVVAYNCSGMTMDLQVQDDQGGGTGSIGVLGMIPDPLDLWSPPGPITGTFYLFDANMDPIAPPQQGADALWSGLAAGDFTVWFTCDSLCSPVEVPVTVGLSVGIAPSALRPTTTLWPLPVSHTLYWSGGVRQRIAVYDALGRIIAKAQASDRFDVGALPAGSYLLRLDEEAPLPFVKW